MQSVQSSGVVATAVTNSLPISPWFDEVLLAGFECSEHRLRDGRRLDLLSSTRHVELADEDYARSRSLGMGAAREGVSWVRSELTRGRCDFSTARRLARAAERQRIVVLWDLMHFGWPDDADISANSSPTRFAKFAKSLSHVYKDEVDGKLFVAPSNEMSFLSWAGGDVRYLNPFEAARRTELKVQLVLVTIEAIEAIGDVVPDARFLSPEPIINVLRTSSIRRLGRASSRTTYCNFGRGRCCQEPCGRGSEKSRTTSTSSD